MKTDNVVIETRNSLQFQTVDIAEIFTNRYRASIAALSEFTESALRRLSFNATIKIDI